MIPRLRGGNYTGPRNRKDWMNLRQTVTDLYEYARASLSDLFACFNMLFVLAVWILGVHLDMLSQHGLTRQANIEFRFFYDFHCFHSLSIVLDM